MSALLRRTLMLKNQELLDFEIDPVTGDLHVLDAPDSNDAQLTSLGLGGPEPDATLTDLVHSRCISRNRKDLSEILDAFGVSTPLELALKGHCLSLTDQFWYRAPGLTERWEDINFFDNNWDGTLCKSFLTGDYSALASCSPDVPDITTQGHLQKAWERDGENIVLLKEPLFENGVDIEGALLAAELCALLFGRDAYQPLYMQERCGKRLSASPLMISRDEELVQGQRLFAMCSIQSQETGAYQDIATPRIIIDILMRAGIADASAHTAKMFTFKGLSLLADLHKGNYGIIRNVHTDERRAAPPFDYDRAFGFPFEDFPLETMCNNPGLARLLCAYSFSDVETSWDWSWYDPQALEGFEERIMEAYAPYRKLPSNFRELVVQLFVSQRDYINGVAGK